MFIEYDTDENLEFFFITRLERSNKITLRRDDPNLTLKLFQTLEKNSDLVENLTPAAVNRLESLSCDSGYLQYNHEKHGFDLVPREKEPAKTTKKAKKKPANQTTVKQKKGKK